MEPDPEPPTYLFSGYARLPQDVSHQALYGRVGVVVEVDEHGAIVRSSSTLVTDLAREFFSRLLAGRSVVTDREALELLIRTRYLGHSQSALIYALRKVFEGVDQSPLAAEGGARSRSGRGRETGPTSSRRCGAMVDRRPAGALHTCNRRHKLSR